MHIVFQHPRGGDHEHDHRWVVIDAAGMALSAHHSPEAGFLAAAGELKAEPDTLRMQRIGPGRFAVRRR